MATYRRDFPITVPVICYKEKCPSLGGVRIFRSLLQGTNRCYEKSPVRGALRRGDLLVLYFADALVLVNIGITRWRKRRRKKDVERHNTTQYNGEHVNRIKKNQLLGNCSSTPRGFWRVKPRGPPMFLPPPLVFGVSFPVVIWIMMWWPLVCGHNPATPRNVDPNFANGSQTEGSINNVTRWSPGLYLLWFLGIYLFFWRGFYLLGHFELTVAVRFPLQGMIFEGPWVPIYFANSYAECVCHGT